MKKSRLSACVRFILLAFCIMLSVGWIPSGAPSAFGADAPSAEQPAADTDELSSGDSDRPSEPSSFETSDQDGSAAVKEASEEVETPADSGNTPNRKKAPAASGSSADEESGDAEGDPAEEPSRDENSVQAPEDAAPLQNSEPPQVRLNAVNQKLLSGDEQYLIRAKVSRVTTGTAPWDDNDEPGNDSGSDNNIVRSYDSINYTVSVVSRGYDSSLSFKSGYTWYRFVIPSTQDLSDRIDESGITEESKILDALGDELEIDVSSMGWMTKGTETDYDYVIRAEKIDGKWCQVLYASNYLTSSTSAFPIALSNVNLALNVRNMKNGDVVRPITYIWIDHNDIDRENWNENYACSDHASAPNKGKELKKITAGEVKVSAAPKYNVQIKPVGIGWVGAEADFDFTTGNEKALNRDDSNNCFGQLREYGLTVQLYNDSPSKGLKGIEMPQGDISFDMDIAAEYAGSRGSLDMDGDALFCPKIWSYDRNNNSKNKQDGRNIADYTSIYNARDAAPLGTKSTVSQSGKTKIRGTAGSGTWTAEQNGSKVSFTISDYIVDTAYIPTLDYPDFNVKDDYPANVGGFSAGQVYLVIPYGKTDNDLLNTYGSGAINLDLQLDNFKAKSVTNQTTTEFRNPPLTHINQSINFIGPGEFINELLWTFPHRDGETGWSDVNNTAMHSNDGGDSAQAGQQVDILFGYGLTNASTNRSWYGADTLMVFEPEAFAFDTKALEDGDISALIELSNPGDGEKQTVTYYFAVRTDSSDPLTEEEMRRINVDGYDNNGEKVADLKYFESYEEAKDAGRIIGALQSVRYPEGTKASLSRLYTTGVLHLKVRSDETAMKDISDGGILNGVYATTSVSRAYAGNGSVMPAAAVTDSGLYNTEELDAWLGDSADTDTGKKAVRGAWTKAVWNEDGSIKNAGAGGHWWGDSVHIVPYVAGVTKNILQTAGAQKSTKNTYNLDNNQNVVDFMMTPTLTDLTLTEGTTPVRITLTDTLDEGLIVDTNKVWYGGIYAENEEQGYAGTFSGGVTTGNTYEGDGVKFESIEQTDELDENGEATGRKILTIVLDNCYVNKELQPIYYSAGIFLPTSYKNRHYENTVVIDAPADKRVKGEPSGNLASAGFTVEKNLSLSLAKRSGKPVYDVGEDVDYVLSWANTGANTEKNCIMMDSMPKDGYGNSKFKGTYNKIKEMTVTAPAASSLDKLSFYYTQESGAEETISGDYTLAEIRGGWTRADIDPDSGKVSLGSGIVPTAWCIVGDIPAKDHVECTFIIDGRDAVSGDVVENSSSLKEGSVQSTTRIAERRLSGLTWLDSDKNGKRDKGEELLPGVSVQLYRQIDGVQEESVCVNNLGEACEMVTDEKGQWEFQALPAGRYTVKLSDGENVKLIIYDLTEKQVSGADREENSDAQAEKNEDDLLEAGLIDSDLDAESIDLPEAWDYASLGYVYEITHLDAGFHRIYPEIDIKKNVDSEVAAAGDPLVFTITVINTGKIDAVDYIVRDTMGKGLEYTGDEEDAGLEWVLTIPAGETKTIRVPARISENAENKVVNKVSIEPPDAPDQKKEDKAVTELTKKEKAAEVAKPDPDSPTTGASGPTAPAPSSAPSAAGETSPDSGRSSAGSGSKTGDESRLLIPLMILLAAAGGAGALAIRRRKN